MYTYTDSTEPSIFAIPGLKNGKKSNQPLRSCLRVKGEYICNGSIENPDDGGSPTSDLEDKLNRLGINKKYTSVTNRTKNSFKDEKKVAFADSKGLPLVTIKLLESPSDLPPVLSEDLLKHIIQGAKPDPDHPYTYIADFEQPAVRYLEFRERIERKCVSLENVMIRDNIQVIGTAKAKNIAFHKFLTARVSFDEWRTFKDVPASFVPTGASVSRYDAFSFEFDIPPNQGGKEFEFCIHYEAPAIGGDFWDNNDGNNYRIVSQEKRVMSQQQLASYYSSLNGHHNWGDFSYWRIAKEETPPETPYW